MQLAKFRIWKILQSKWPEFLHKLLKKIKGQGKEEEWKEKKGEWEEKRGEPTNYKTSRRHGCTSPFINTWAIYGSNDTWDLLQNNSSGKNGSM